MRKRPEQKINWGIVDAGFISSPPRAVNRSKYKLVAEATRDPIKWLQKICERRAKRYGPQQKRESEETPPQQKFNRRRYCRRC